MKQQMHRKNNSTVIVIRNFLDAYCLNNSSDIYNILTLSATNLHRITS